jgi:hypothetical protein
VALHISDYRFTLACARIHVRHVRNLYIFRHVFARDGVSGRIEYARTFARALSAYEMVAFAIVSLVAWLAEPSAFLAGGTVGCLSLAVRHIPVGPGHGGDGGIGFTGATEQRRIVVR